MKNYSYNLTPSKPVQVFLESHRIQKVMKQASIVLFNTMENHDGILSIWHNHTTKVDYASHKSLLLVYPIFVVQIYWTHFKILILHIKKIKSMVAIAPQKGNMENQVSGPLETGLVWVGKAGPLEKTLMLGGIGGRRRKG